MSSLAAKPSDNQLREKLFRAHPSYQTEKDKACYVYWATGSSFERCNPNCGCPRARLISQADVDAERARCVDQSYAKVLALLRSLWNNGSPLDPPPPSVENALTLELARLVSLSEKGAELANPANLAAAMSGFQRIVYN
jgi:hypothetical protein